MHDPTKTFLSIAKSFFTTEEIPYYDISIPFKEAAEKSALEGKSFVIPIDFHPSRYGAEAIARLSWPWIKQQLKKN